MPSTITRPIATRLTHAQREQFLEQAARFNLTPSAALAALVAGALAAEGAGSRGGPAGQPAAAGAPERRGSGAGSARGTSRLVGESTD